MKKTFILIGILITQNLYSQKEIIADYAFTNASIVTMSDDKVLVNRTLLVQSGKIIAITKSENKQYKATETINLKGKFIMPSLSDAHVHLPKKEQELRKFFILNLINGVTKVRSMRGQWDHIKWKEKYNTNGSYYPKLYISSPPISWKYELDDSQIDRYINSAKKFDFIKVLSIKNETTFIKLNKACEKYKIDLAGHFPNNVSDNILFNSNYRSFEHLGGLVEKSILSNDRLQKIKENNIFLCPTLSWYSIGSGQYNYDELRNLRGMKYVREKKMSTWINKTKAYREKLGVASYKQEVKDELAKLDYKFNIIKKAHSMGIKMLLSPDSSSKYMMYGFGVLDEMKLLKKSGLSNYQILEMTTRNFADFFGGNYGTIQVGKDADFIILNENPIEKLDVLKNVEGVFFNSNYLDKKDLNKLSNDILPK